MKAPADSKIPPRVLAKARRLSASDRRAYVQELIGTYEYRARHLDKTAREMVDTYIEHVPKWAKRQRAHFEEVIAELYILRDE